jgi:hypothetical protein
MTDTQEHVEEFMQVIHTGFLDKVDPQLCISGGLIDYLVQEGFVNDHDVDSIKIKATSPLEKSAKVKQITFCVC